MATTYDRLTLNAADPHCSCNDCLADVDAPPTHLNLADFRHGSAR